MMPNNGPMIWDEDSAKMLNTGALEFRDGTKVYVNAGDPNGVISAPAGSVVFDTTNRKCWRNSSTANDTWLQDVATMPHDSLASISGGIASNRTHYAHFDTVAGAKASVAAENVVCYVAEKDMMYSWVASSLATADDDLVLATGSGGTTRWEAIQKLTRSNGDNGWIDVTGATTTALNTTTVCLTMGTAGVFAVKGIRVDIPIGNYDFTVTGAAGVKYIGFDDESLVLKQRDTLWDFDAECPVSICYWNGTSIVAAPQTEYHMAKRNTVWHKYSHTYLGYQYYSGLSFTGSVQTDNNVDPGANDTVTYLWSTTGVCDDEDARSTPGAGQWLQTLGSGLTSATAAIFNFFYYNGTIVTAFEAMADRSPFPYTGENGTPQWNDGGTLTATVTGDYAVFHYFANPMTGGWSVFCRPHNAKFTSLAAARAARPTQLTWSNYAELKHIYTAIYRVNTGWSTTHRCKLVALDDYRTVPGTPIAAEAPTSHQSLSSLELAGTGVTYGHVSDQAQTIAGPKTFSSCVTTPCVNETLTAVSSNATLTADQRHIAVTANSQVDIALPLVASVPAGKRYTIKVVAGASVCNIVANGTEYLDGVNAAYPIYLDGAVEVISTGSYWLLLWTRNEAPTNLFSTGTINNRAENIFTTQGSAITLTLPNSLTKWGKKISIKNLGTGIVTVTRQGSDTIDGLVSVAIPVNGTLSLMLKGTVWQIISRVSYEAVSASVARGSAVSCTSGQWQDITSISLTIGTWMLSGTVCGVGTSTAATIEGGVGTTTGNSGAGIVEGDGSCYGAFNLATVDTHNALAPTLVSITATTTYYLKIYFSGTGTCGGFGTIRAIRQ